MRLFTIGHGTASQAELVALLRRAGIARLIDVRTVPRSKRNPHVSREAMERWLPVSGIRYRWEPALGGFRKPDPASFNVGLRHRAFRGYADHMRTPEFAEALDRVLDEPGTVVMCSENVWWRCHRRLLSDAAVLLREAEVVHVMHDARLVPHVLTVGVRRDGDLLVYDGGQPPLG